VSDLGRVRSNYLLATRRRRSPLRPPPPAWRILRPSVNPQTGYHTVTLTRGRFAYVHHLVLEAFVGPRRLGTECRHLNGIRGDNRAVNLKWGTRRDQALDRRIHGTALVPVGPDNRGERNGRAILNEEAVRWIKSCGLPVREVAARLGIADTTVKNIRNGYRWKHVQASSDGSSQNS
jgi:hypothetical protein